MGSHGALALLQVNAKLLIDAIVRQTSVLIGQLSTAAGIRSPLAHVADQVFVDPGLKCLFAADSSLAECPCSQENPEGWSCVL